MADEKAIGEIGLIVDKGIVTERGGTRPHVRVTTTDVSIDGGAKISIDAWRQINRVVRIVNPPERKK